MNNFFHSHKNPVTVVLVIIIAEDFLHIANYKPHFFLRSLFQK